MNSNQTQWSMILVGALAGTVGVLAFLMLLVMGEWALTPAFFVAALIAIVVAIVLLFGFHDKPAAPKGSHAAPDAASSAGSHATSAPAPAAEAPVAVAPAAAAPAPAPEPAPSPAPASAPEPAPEPAPAPAPASADVGAQDKPELLSAPREGGADDLKMIKGVGPKMETMLHGMGIFHFDQIAKWSERELAWVDANLEGFKGRASRDAWVSQARTLAAGGATEFSERVKDGDVY